MYAYFRGIIYQRYNSDITQHQTETVFITRISDS